MDIALILITLCIGATGIFFFVRWAWCKIFPEYNGMVDHVLVNCHQPEAKPEPVKPSGTTPEEAKARHGKKFRAHVLVARETPPSRDLEDYNAASAKNAARHTITPIKSKK